MAQGKEWLDEFISSIPKDVLSFLTKVLASLLYIGVGIIGIIGNRLMHNKSIKDWRFVGSLLVALCVGYLSSVYCLANMPEAAKYVVPICTLFSEKIVIILSSWVEKKIKKQLED